MMHFVFISKAGDILPLAQRLEAEQHQVVFYVCAEPDGISDKHITQSGPDIVIVDAPGFGKLANRLKHAGFTVIGSSLLTDRLESDPFYSEKVLRMCGLVASFETNGSAGTQVDIEGWFNGKDFITFTYTIDSVSVLGHKGDKLYKECLANLVLPLKKSKHVGPVSISATLTRDTACYSRLSTHFTLTTLLFLREGIGGRVGDAMNTLSGSSSKPLHFRQGWFISVQMVMNPNPLFTCEPYRNIPVQGLSDESLKHVWLYGITKKNKDYDYSGHGGRIAVATARGSTIREARRRVYRTIHHLSIPGMLCLPKVGNKATLQYSQVKNWGWVT